MPLPIALNKAHGITTKSGSANIHDQIKIQSHNSHGRESLAQYIPRYPSSQQKDELPGGQQDRPLPLKDES